MSEYKFHPAAAIFPLMDEVDLRDLADDIAAHGLREPIKLFEGQILDGRNRCTACTMVGVDKRYEEIQTDDPVAFVLSLNLHRRQLTTSERAMVAAKKVGYEQEQAKKRQHAAGARGKDGGRGNTSESLSPKRDEGFSDPNSKRSTAQAGKALGVSRNSVDRALKVLESGDETLIKAVETGKMTVAAAVNVLDGKATPESPHRQKRMPNSVAVRLHEQLVAIDQVLAKPSTQISFVDLRKRVKDVIALVSKYME